MKPLLETIDTRLGTASKHAFSRGNTLPYTGVPFGMNYFVPQTSDQDGSWFFDPHLPIFQGIRLTHQPVLGLGTTLGSFWHLSQANWVETVSSIVSLPMIWIRPLSNLIIWRFSPCAIRLKPSSHRLATVLLFVWSKSKAKPSPSIFTQQRNWPWIK